MTLWSRLVGLATAVAVTVAACDDGGGTRRASAPSASSTASTTSRLASSTTTIPEAATTSVVPEPAEVVHLGADGVESVITDTSRLVSLNGDLTEIIFELGRGEDVVGVDATTTFPPEAAGLPSVGFAQRLTPEAVLALEPTLVIGDQQVAPAEALQQVRAAGVPVAILPVRTTLEGVGAKIGEVATLLGEEAGGTELAARVEGDIAAARADGAGGGVRAVFLYARGPQTVFVFGAGAPTQALLEAAGAIDAAAEAGAPPLTALTPEALAAAAPEVVVTTTASLESLGGEDALVALPAVAATVAGSEGRVLAYDDALVLGFGPRVGEALALLAADLAAVELGDAASIPDP